MQTYTNVILEILFPMPTSGLYLSLNCEREKDTFKRKFLNFWLNKINYQPVNKSKNEPEKTSDYPRKFETKWVRKIFSIQEKTTIGFSCIFHLLG